MERKLESWLLEQGIAVVSESGSGPKIILKELLRNGTLASLKANKELLKTSDGWDAEMAAEAALAIERLTLPGRRIIFEALNTRKNLIPNDSLIRLER